MLSKKQPIRNLKMKKQALHSNRTLTVKMILRKKMTFLIRTLTKMKTRLVKLTTKRLLYLGKIWIWVRNFRWLSEQVMMKSVGKKFRKSCRTLRALVEILTRILNQRKLIKRTTFMTNLTMMTNRMMLKSHKDQKEQNGANKALGLKMIVHAKKVRKIKLSCQMNKKWRIKAKINRRKEMNQKISWFNHKKKRRLLLWT